MKSNWWKIAVVVGIVIAAGVILAGKSGKGGPGVSPGASVVAPPADSSAIEPPNAGEEMAADQMRTDTNATASVEKKKATDDLPDSGQSAGSGAAASKTTSATAPAAAAKPKSNSTPKVTKKLPRLVDLGASKCVPCKMMAPILEELKAEYKGRLIVEFIDVWENSGAGDKYGINSIPTQIFFDETGKEFSRHVGFMPREDILATFKEHGINLEKGK